MTTQTTCPCPECFNCCCNEVEGLNPADCVNNDEGTCGCNKQAEADPFVQVLCGCGWGSLKMRESDVPVDCPVCGNALRQGDDEGDDEDDYDDSMDGDHDSAMASCGWGTDEDYGCYGDDGW